MKSVLAVVALCFTMTAQAQMYIIGGGSFAVKSRSFSVGVGVRGEHVGGELAYTSERFASQTVTHADGSTTGGTHTAHGFGGALLAFAPIGSSIELVGRVSIDKLHASDGFEDETRRSVGIGGQYSRRDGFAARLMFERAGDHNQLAARLLYSF